MEELKKIPEMYVKGKGVRFGSSRNGVKIMEDVTDRVSIKSKGDMANFMKIVRLCFASHWASQTLTVKKAAGNTTGMSISDMEKILGESRTSVRTLLRWGKEKHIWRRDIFGNIVVNPTVILLGRRVSATEYATYRDELKFLIGGKWKQMLEAEYSEIREEYENDIVEEEEI